MTRLAAFFAFSNIVLLALLASVYHDNSAPVVNFPAPVMAQFAHVHATDIADDYFPAGWSMYCLEIVGGNVKMITPNFSDPVCWQKANTIACSPDGKTCTGSLPLQVEQ